RGQTKPELDLAGALRALGAPVTQQRLAIYGELRRAKDHPSAEAVHRRLGRRFPSLSLATVYKTLQAFSRLGLAALVNAPRAEARYDAITRRHHHLICEACGRIADVFDSRLDALRPPKLPPGFKLSGHSVHFRGLCPACARRGSFVARQRTYIKEER
ncbi:MAG: transcriptional repressor, partial [Elusimicrobia bacterium]|nr:transcriptional repressor [Elusimicrobiota bacterium]